MLEDLHYIGVERPGTFCVHDQLRDTHVLRERRDEVAVLLPCGSGDVQVGEVGVTLQGLHEPFLHGLPSDFFAREVELGKRNESPNKNRA